MKRTRPVAAELNQRLPGTSTAIREDRKAADVSSVIAELSALGINIVPGNVTTSNKPTINSNNGG